MTSSTKSTMTSSTIRQLVVAAGGSSSAASICEGCKYRHSLWYCDVDEAFLCQVCDASVHSANPLASGIQINAIAGAQAGNATDPAWHQFTRKPRTPRHHQHSKGQSIVLVQPLVPELVVQRGHHQHSKGQSIMPVQPLVPELEEPTGHHQHSKRQSIIPVQPLVPELEVPMDDNTEEEELLLQYRVPIFDPMFFHHLDYPKSVIPLPNISQPVTITNDNTEFDIVDFSANIDSLLEEEGRSFCIEELGLVESREREVGYYCIGESLEVKPEIGEDNTMPQIYGECKVIKPELGRITEEDNSRETLEFDFTEYGSLEAKDDNVAVELRETRMSLSIDYEAIIVEWSNSHLSSPWMDGQRPQLSHDEYFWPDYMEQNMWNGGVPVQIEGGVDDRGREERLLRYREKRRRRLFSKKIRYEVRKLNAENRPRMKGRFVKKSNFTPRPTL